MSAPNPTLPRRLLPALAASLAALLLAACAGPASHDPDHAQAGEGRATLTVLATSDLHGHVLGYDYYRLRDDPAIGLDRVATLIAQARERDRHSLLVDVGDTIQGSALSDWQARVQPPACDRTLAIYEAMSSLGFDAATLGNHEFNYGLPFLQRVTGLPYDDSASTCRGPDFPIVVSNLSNIDGQPLYPRHLLLERTLPVVAADGRSQPTAIRIGIVGFVPPRIMDWDRGHLEGRVAVDGVLESAREQVANLRRQGADIVLALVHGGIDARPYTAQSENAAWHLAATGQVDAMVMAHQHQRFPDPDNPRRAFADVDGVDHERGRVHGIPAVMASYWGKGLGVIELSLVHRQGQWQVDAAGSRSQVQTIDAAADADGRSGPVDPDPALQALVQAEHQATLAHVSQPLASSDFTLASHFADVGEVSALQVVNMAQADFISTHVQQHLPQYRDLPVLSAAAPFRTGFAGPDDYTRVPAGTLAVRHAADLYLYPNTLVAVLIDGAGLKIWLEQAARRFNQIDPALTSPQDLVNSRFPGYNFDVIHGIQYAIDLSRPVGERIVSVTFQGQPVTAEQRFIVATNNYRAASGRAFGLDESALIVDTRLESRQVLADWLRGEQKLTRSRHGTDLPWQFAPLPLAGQLVFDTGADLEPPAAGGLPSTHRLRRLDDAQAGRARYALDLGGAD
ncbi:MAG: bifunctional 2',3'-cyclic-nucleotide 2'-phosphodiesterase/3'-nucleotidase [Xanthomonadales bacterium]|nr:bifunctional 2',3'-cyclic-nucleotide 2'-phosphodiesterase/3'-nucleotidase [Xanthomonadales bacterium]